MPRRGPPRHKVLPKNFLAVLTRPGALRARPEQQISFETLPAAIRSAESHIAKWHDEKAAAEIFDVTGEDRVKVWPRHGRSRKPPVG